MPRPSSCVVAVLCGVGLSGCATLDRGSTDKVYVQSEPSGAQATTSAGASCMTPCALDVGRRDEFSVVIAKAGYAPQTVEVKTRLNPYGVGDLMENTMSGGLGLIVDAGTGASLEHVPDPVVVTLARAAK